MNRRKFLTTTSIVTTVSLAGCMESEDEKIEYETIESKYISNFEAVKINRNISNDKIEYTMYINDDVIESNFIISVYNRDEETHITSKQMYTGERKIEFQNNYGTVINNIEILIIQNGEIEKSSFGLSMGVKGGEIIERINLHKK